MSRYITKTIYLKKLEQLTFEMEGVLDKYYGFVKYFGFQKLMVAWIQTYLIYLIVSTTWFLHL